MDFLGKLFPQLAPPAPSQEPATRWEKAVTALNGISKQVTKIDPDGVDVYCFPGAEEEVDKFEKVTKTDAVKKMVLAQEPGGTCTMCAALTMAFDDAFERGFDPPCAMLVFTAGQPEDPDAVTALIQERAAQLENANQLSVTFVHVGDDPDAEAFLAALDGLEVAGASGDPIDMVDTVKDEDMKNAMEELKDPSFMESGGKGGMLGALAGMAVGAGVYYAYNKYQAKKRTEGWNGTWEVKKQPDNESTGVTLTVTDDGEGNLTIEGYPEDEEAAAGIPSTSGNYVEDDDNYTISRQDANGEFISGNIVDEHMIEWQDGFVWEEVPPEGINWTHLVAAAGAGAAAGGAMGYLCQKKFFNKADNQEPANYMIVMDRSEKMIVMDGA